MTSDETVKVIEEVETLCMSDEDVDISEYVSNSDEEAELTEYDDYYEEDSLSDVDRGDHDTNSSINLNDRIRRLTSHLEYNSYTSNKYYKSTCTIDRYKLDDILEDDYVNPEYTAPLSKYDNVHHRKVTSVQFAKLSQRKHYRRTQYKKLVMKICTANF